MFEPIVVERTTADGWAVCFSTTFERYKRNSDGTLTSHLIDNQTCAHFTVHSRLGSNTCVPSASNLAWKVSHVEAGFAGAALLASYSPERQPVGTGVVARANRGIRDRQSFWKELGMLEGILPSAYRAWQT
ncbi:hypothetical protein SEUCBS140593_010351 [Sporothrix eucalyptigena]|uniref:FAD-binding domain-containing protein n=1 Tax=Sporothrix eucalyptigena TaxID=1812306 RepID=A0ABP0D2V7_9PEZI